MDHGRIAPMGALLLLVLPLMVSMEMDKIGIPGIPGIPGFPGKDGRNGLKGDMGEPAYTNMQNDHQGNVGVPGPAGKRGAGGEPGGKGEPGIPGPPGQDVEDTFTAAEAYSAFSVSRSVPGPPQRNQPIIFSNVITNYNNDFNTDTGHFRCSVPGTYYFVYHASSTEKMCILLMMNGTRLGSWCDIKTTRNIRQVSSGGLAVYLQREQEVWLETSDHRAMTSIPAGVSLFSGFLMHPQE